MKLKLLFASILLISMVDAQTAGTFDNTFGINGKILSTSPDILTVADITLQADNKIITVGETNTSNRNFGVVRYLQNGSLDASFGNSGISNIDLYGYNDYATTAIIQADGKILVAGYSETGQNTYREFSVIRLNTNGTLDTTFGTGGKTIIDFGGGPGEAQALALQSDGKIIVAGSASTGGSSVMYFAVARLNIDGSLDLDFSNDGKQTKVLISNSNNSCIQKVKVLSDGKILLGGYAGTALSTSISLMKLLPDGSFDTSFNTTGSKTNSSITTWGFDSYMTFLPDNSILYGGVSNNDTYIYKLNSNLDVINSFGNNGSVTVDIDNSSSERNVKRIIFDSLGNFYATGITTTGGSDYFYILNFTSNGTLNNQFSYDGKLLINFGSSSHSGVTAILQPDSKLLVGGSYIPYPYMRAAIARINVQAGALGTKDLSKKTGFSLYPNPVSNFLNINNIEKSLFNEKVQVLDATGRILLQENILDENLQLNISHLASGTYYIKIGEKINKKIIKN